MNQITHKDLDEALDRQALCIKEHINLKLEPVNKTLDAHQKTLHGMTGSNGISGSIKVLKWGYALIAGAVIFFAKEVFKL